jgi:hypothetical protein
MRVRGDLQNLEVVYSVGFVMKHFIKKLLLPPAWRNEGGESRRACRLRGTSSGRDGNAKVVGAAG